MKQFDKSFLKAETFLNIGRKPDFNNLLRVLNREKPGRPTLFEMFINNNAIDMFTAHLSYDANDPLISEKKLIDGCMCMGYDFAMVRGPSFRFKTNRHRTEGKASISLNEGYVITDRESFDAYNWMEPEDADYGWLSELSEYLPDGMKMLIPGPDGVFETVTALVGYDNLCLMLYDEPELVEDVFNAVGSRYLRYYKKCST